MMKELSNDQLAFFIARITIGLNLLLHGIVRLPKLQKFAKDISSGFTETLLPERVAYIFATGLPFLETALGIALLIGFKTRWATTLSAFLIALLIFGSALKEDWGAVGTQMVYVIFFFLLIKNLEYDVWGITAKQKKTVHGFTTKK